jgi:hypothetical protein
MRRASNTFPLRFESETMREALHDLAEQMGVSMNRLAQDALAAQLGLTATILEARLERTLNALRLYRGAWSDEEVSSFARAEVEHEDPAEGRQVEPRNRDPFGVLRAFADPVER